jgi:hypothetical protein
VHGKSLMRAAHNMMGLQWLIPIGEERLFKWLMVACGVWRLGAAFFGQNFMPEQEPQSPS